MSEERAKIVIDTNALLSALISPRGTVAQAVASAFLHAEIIQSAETYAELGEKLASRKLQKYIPADLRQEALSFFAEAAAFVEAPAVATACRDPKDNKFLDIAAAGGATLLISGDKDLQALQGQETQLGYTFAIVTPRSFLDAHPLPENTQIDATVPAVFAVRGPATNL